MSVCFTQVLNGNFEEWQTADSIENPVYWETNNYYVGYTPVAKTTDAIEGNYSMKVSSTARDIWGTATGYGCAHVKFIPTEVYTYLTASVRVDTVDMDGEISIRVKQWSPGNELFEKIDTWKQTTATNGVVQVILPIEQVGLDTLLIEVWAKNHYDPFTNTIGYTEVIIDKLQLTNTVAAHEPDNENGLDWAIFPNPAIGIVNVRLNQPCLKPCLLSLFDLHGRVLQKHSFLTFSEVSLNIAGYLPGVYILELNVQGEVFALARIAKDK